MGKAGEIDRDSLNRPDANWLLKSLERGHMVKICPDGRPEIIRIGFGDDCYGPYCINCGQSWCVQCDPNCDDMEPCHNRHIQTSKMEKEKPVEKTNEPKGPPLFQKGDKVIYLGESGDICHGKHDPAPSRAKDRGVVGRLYTVENFVTDESWDCVGGIKCVELPLPAGSPGQCAGRFRKVSASSEDIVQRLKAKMTPIGNGK